MDEGDSAEFDAPNLALHALAYEADAERNAHNAGLAVCPEEYAQHAFDMGLGRNSGKRNRQSEDVDVLSPSRLSKRLRKVDPPPRNPFRDIVTKGLISPEEGRELWDW